MNFSELRLEQLPSINFKEFKVNFKKEDETLQHFIQKLTTTKSISCNEYLNMNDENFNAIRNLIHDIRKLYYLNGEAKKRYIEQLEPEQKNSFNKLHAIIFSNKISTEIDSIKNNTGLFLSQNDNSAHF